MPKKKIANSAAIRLQELQVEMVPIDSLTPNEYNPNRQSEHEFDLLKRSIQEDGFTQPVLVMRDGKIVDGEHRWRACKALGHTEIAVVKVDMTEAQRRIATLRHNLARGSHDVELTANLFKDFEQLGALDWAQDALQLDDIEIQRMLHDMTPLDEYGQEDYGSSWDYSPVDNQDGSSMEAAKSSSELPTNPIERQRELQRRGMEAEDAQLVKRSFTFTKSQEAQVREALGTKPADAVLAIAQAHTDAKERSGRGEWTTLTFVVPTQALLVIEQELDRLRSLAPNRNPDLTPELQRGLALEYMAVLSGQTPEESLK